MKLDTGSEPKIHFKNSDNEKKLHFTLDTRQGITTSNTTFLRQGITTSNTSEIYTTLFTFTLVTVKTNTFNPSRCVLYVVEYLLMLRITRTSVKQMNIMTRLVGYYIFNFQAILSPRDDIRKKKTNNNKRRKQNTHSNTSDRERRGVKAREIQNNMCMRESKLSVGDVHF